MSLKPKPAVKEAPRGASVLPHVTDVFQPRVQNPYSFNEAAVEKMALGVAVHKACEDFDRYGGVENLREDVSGYLVAWEACLAKTKATVVEVELTIGGDEFGYTGTLDRVVLIGNKLALWDIKTGKKWPTHGPQTAAYENAYRQIYMPNRAKPIARACVHLSSNGEFELVPHVGVHDLSTFLAYLKVYRFELAHGLRKQPPPRS